MEEQQKLRQLYEVLKTNDLKLTPVRRFMLKTFSARSEDLLKAAELLELVKTAKPKTNFSTIFRNLELFVKTGLVEKIFYDGSTAYKLINEAVQQHSHHMICTLCHKTEPLPYCPVADLEATLQQGNGFLPLDHRIEVYGYCKTCRNKPPDLPDKPGKMKNEENV